MNLVGKNGEVKLPPGFRFHPTDEELVVQYLKRKVFSFPLPASIIPEADLCKSDPWDLPGNLEEERYFFSTKEAKYPNGNRSNRATNSGYWKATGLDKQILIRTKSEVVGMKKTLVFYTGKPPHGSRTDWIMHEYRLANHSSHSFKENWVLCRIFLKKRSGVAVKDSNLRVKSKNSSNSNNLNKVKEDSKVVVFYDFLAQNNNNGVNMSSISPATSGITDELDVEHEESSGSFSLTPPNCSQTNTKP